uniref:Uncharacterized protein n=1 Tax=Knipowitschia caucasica TaxID=637954 RepID=A0AAV2J3X4_KNICA
MVAMFEAIADRKTPTGRIGAREVQEQRVFQQENREVGIGGCSSRSGRDGGLFTSAQVAKERWGVVLVAQGEMGGSSSRQGEMGGCSSRSGRDGGVVLVAFLQGEDGGCSSRQGEDGGLF